MLCLLSRSYDSRSLELFVEHSLESWSIDDVKSLLFVREKDKGMLLDTLHNPDRLIVGHFLCSDVLECKIDNEAQAPDLFALFCDCLLQFVVIHVTPPPTKVTMLQVAG
jgi:hypothetical protein